MAALLTTCSMTSKFFNAIGRVVIGAFGGQSRLVSPSMFCIGPVGEPSVNATAGLPGLGKLKLFGTAQGLP